MALLELMLPSVSLSYTYHQVPRYLRISMKDGIRQINISFSVQLSFA